MADIAVFSSFHRTRDQGTWPVRDGGKVKTAAVGPQTAPIVPDHLPSPLPPAPLPDTPVAGAEWANLSDVVLSCDLLGLAHPHTVSLCAQLSGFEPVPLEADLAGIYRPPGFQPTPWSSFAFDPAMNLRVGLAAGTRLLTARGEVEVENLVPGDSVLTLRDPALLPVIWIGRSIGSAPPIRIRVGSVGPNTPRQDLYVGPDHAVFLNATPVPASTLAAGNTAQDRDGLAPELFHVDVGRPEIIFVEGVAVATSDRGRPHL